MARLVDTGGGAKGIDIDTPKGRVSIEPNRGGGYEVNNPQAINALKEAGFMELSLASFGNVEGGNCVCGFNSVFKKFVCPKCGVENDHRSS